MSLNLEVKLYQEMLRIRMVEEKLIELYQSGLMRSLMHLSTGQEAVAVGVCQNLNREDVIVSTHRCHAHYLAKGGNMKAMFAEIAGKVGGCSRGRGGSMHLFDLNAGVALSLPIVGSTIPKAVGIAQAIKLRGEKRIAVAFFGDGAVEEGVFWESINFAVVHQLPVLFVCENNLYATHSHIAKRQLSTNIVDRIEPHGLTCFSIDGNNIFETYNAVLHLVKDIRDGLGPAFIEAKTYRLKEHWGPGEDWHLGYRSEEEGDSWKKRCPIKHIKNILRTRGFDHLETIRSDIRKEIEEAYQFAQESLEPSEEELMQWEVKI